MNSKLYYLGLITNCFLYVMGRKLNMSKFILAMYWKLKAMYWKLIYLKDSLVSKLNQQNKSTEMFWKTIGKSDTQLRKISGYKILFGTSAVIPLSEYESLKISQALISPSESEQNSWAKPQNVKAWHGIKTLPNQSSWR